MVRSGASDERTAKTVSAAMASAAMASTPIAFRVIWLARSCRARRVWPTTTRIVPAKARSAKVRSTTASRNGSPAIGRVAKRSPGGGSGTPS